MMHRRRLSLLAVACWSLAAAVTTLHADPDATREQLEREGVDVVIVANAPEPDEVTQRRLDLYHRFAEEHPDLAPQLLEQYPELRAHLGIDERGAPGEPEPARMGSPADADDGDAGTVALLDSVERRRRADALVGELADASDARLGAIERELAALGNEAMVALRVGELSDHFEVRRRAAQLAGRVRWRQVSDEALRQAFPELIEVMASEDDAGRAALVDRISERPPAGALDFLRECLADRQRYVRHRAVDGLANVASRHARHRAAAVGLLEDALDDDGDRDQLMLVISALTRLRQFDIDRLAGLLNHRATEVRRSAIRALGHSRQAAAVAHVLPALEDDEWRVRAAAIEALDQLRRQAAQQRPQIADAVVPLLGDEDQFVRANAAELLSALRPGRATPMIREAIDDGRIDAGRGMELLARMGDSDTLTEILERLLDGPADAAHRDPLIEMLSHYNDSPRVERFIRAALDDEDYRTSWPTLITVARGRDALIDPLLEKLTDEQLPVAQAAWDAVFYTLRDRELSRSLLDELWHWPEAQRRQWVLDYAYRYEDEPAGRLIAALESNEPALADRALAMLGELHLDDAFGEPLPYRQASQMHHGYGPSPRGDGQGGASRIERWMAPAAAVVGDAERPLRTRVLAAALLHRHGRAEDAVMTVLRNALSHESPELRKLALAGIQSDPEPFHEGIRFEPLLDDPVTLERALLVMGATGDPRYHDAILARVAHTDRTDPRMIYVLATLDDDRAAALALERISDPGTLQRHVRELARRFTGASSDRAVAFVGELWALEDLQQWHQRELVEVMLTLESPQAIPLLESALERNESASLYIDTRAVRARLRELEAAH